MCPSGRGSAVYGVSGGIGEEIRYQVNRTMSPNEELRGKFEQSSFGCAIFVRDLGQRIALDGVIIIIPIFHRINFMAIQRSVPSLSNPCLIVQGQDHYNYGRPCLFCYGFSKNYLLFAVIARNRRFLHRHLSYFAVVPTNS